MTRTAPAAMAVSLVFTGCLHFPTEAGATPIRYCRSTAELSVSASSRRNPGRVRATRRPEPRPTAPHAEQIVDTSRQSGGPSTVVIRRLGS